MNASQRFQKAIATFDDYNSKDPNQVEIEGSLISKELLYARRMTEKLHHFSPEASVPVQLAVRCQHIGRWEIPRNSYPITRKGYLQWRNSLKLHHASIAEKILRDCPYDEGSIEKVKFLVLKQQLQQHPESQLLEDIICLVFVEYYLEEFAAKHDDEKIVDILTKTLRKMSDRGINTAVQISLSDKMTRLLKRATETPEENLLFKFEEEFMEGDIRCIPMIVRFRLDACGIKLKLSEWNNFSLTDRAHVVRKAAVAGDDRTPFRNLIRELVLSHTGNEATDLEVDLHPGWAIVDKIQTSLMNKLNEFGWEISLHRWKALTDVQRFVLLKLSRPSHKNKNFPKAMKEFGLTGSEGLPAETEAQPGLT